MKFHLPSIKQILVLIVTVFLCIAAGLLLMMLAYTVFPMGSINQHAKESAKVFKTEGRYTVLDLGYTSMLDNFTDSIMLKKAAYDGPEDALYKVMEAPSWSLADKAYEWPTDEYVAYYSKSNPEPRTVSTYPRYWHGYIIPLKATLMFNNFGQIRALNLYIQIALSLLVIALMIIKHSWQAIPAYVISVLQIGMYPTAYCLQFATVFYIVSFSCITLLLFNNKISSSTGRLIYFVVLGAITSFMDFLTYPLATFGMTAVLYLCLNREDNLQTDIRNTFNLLICWGIGYVGMWFGKWLLATIFTDQNIIQDAIDTIRFRTSNEVYGTAFSYGDILRKNVDAYIDTRFYSISLIIAIVEVVLLIVLKNKMNWKLIASLLLVSVLPFGWFALASNHCFIHYWFTNKILMATTFAVLVALACWNPQRNFKKNQKGKK